VPRLISEITEIATGLGMLGFDDVADALRNRPAELVDVDDAAWARVVTAWEERRHHAEFVAALTNGAVFLSAPDALRGRRPARVEWRGPHQSPGDEVVPADLRIDHVYLISCKYLSHVLHNTAPARLFDRALTAGPRPRSEPEWYSTVAAPEHQRLYDEVRRHHGDGLDLPMRARDVSPEQRRRLRDAVPRDWAGPCVSAYADLCAAVSRASATRWAAQLTTPADRRAMLWRLLRIGSAPYYVLGTDRSRTIRLRVATPWDWDRAFELRSFEVVGDGTGQPRVAWRAEVRARDSRETAIVEGHVEVRWSHGRFNLPPEAKVYLDTPHHRVPGYWPLT
jgi:hypothetical protein